jgi:hypothetical protein
LARVALRKADLESGPGVELLALCQTITEDGSLSDAEVADLRTWLNDNRTAELPAIGILASLVETVIRDGKVTKAERGELHRMLEKVLPPELRAVAVSRRRIATAEAREQAKAENAAEKERKAAEALRDSPIDGANFMVAGSKYEGRDQVIRQHARAGDRVFLVRDRANQYSHNAIEIRLANGMQIGFVPEDDAVTLAPFLDRGALHSAIITKILAGGRSPIPVVDVDLYNPDAQVPNLMSESQVPARQAPKSAGSPWDSVDTRPASQATQSSRSPHVAQRTSLRRWLAWALLLLVAFLVIKGLLQR